MSPHSLTPGLMLYAKQDCPAIYRLTVRMQTVFNHCLSRETQAVTRSHTPTLTVMHAQSQTNTHCHMQSQTHGESMHAKLNMQRESEREREREMQQSPCIAGLFVLF